MKKIIIFLIIVVLIVGTGLGIYYFTSPNSPNYLENNIASSKRLIKKNNKKYLENKKEEDKEWNQILGKMSNTDNLSSELKDKYIVGVGDSVFLASIPELKKVFPNSYFDGKVSRTLTMGLPILRSLKEEGKLSDTIIIGLSTNGDFLLDKCEEFMTIVENRTVYWVNSVGADDPKFNEKFEEFAKKYSNIHIVRWDKKAEGHSEYFYDDGIHTREPGIIAYKEVVYDTIYNDYITKQKETEKNKKLINEHKEETNKRIAFYGNDLLLNSYKLINKDFNNSYVSAKRNYTYDEVYKDLSERIKNKELEHQLVLMFDSSSKLTNEEYKKIIELCKGHKIYVVNINLENFVLDNSVTVIDLYPKLERRKDYLMDDQIHLTKDGTKYLVKSLIDVIK